MMAFVLTAIIVCIVSAIAAAVASRLYDPADLSEIRALFTPRWQKFANPENVERVAYLAGVLSSVPAALFAASLATGLKFKQSSWGAILTGLIMAAFLSTTLLQPALFSYVLKGGTRGTEARDAFLWLAIIIVLMTAAAIAVWRFSSVLGMVFSSKRLTSILNASLICVLLLSVGAVRVRSANMANPDLHVEAVLYSITQVVAGKTFLIDFPAQYGAYAEILHPVFSIFGLSVFSFSIVMTVLQAASVLCIAYVCFSIVRNAIMRSLLILTICVFVGNSWLELGSRLSLHAEYYQIWPIRFFFPAVGLAAFFFVRRYFHQERKAFFSLSLLSGIAIVWNLDSGVPVYGAIVAYLLLRLLFAPAEARSLSLQLALIGIVVPLLVVVAFAGFLMVKSSGDILWSDVTKYQRIFYATGFGMLRMPLSPHPWMAVLSLYLFGMVGAVCAHKRGRPSVTWDTILVISVLGTGLFTYYQGRSHDHVLSFVVWPAIILAFIFSDQLLRGIRSGALSGWLGLGIVPVVLFGGAMSLSMILSIPYFAWMSYDVLKTSLSDRPDRTTRAVEFIKAKVGESRSAVIIDPGQSVYFAETGLASAVSGPGYGELLLAQDRDRQIENMLSQPVDHLFVRRDNKDNFPDEYSRLLSKYKSVDVESSGLEYLRPIR